MRILKILSTTIFVMSLTAPSFAQSSAAGGAGSANAGAQGVLGPATSASSGGGRTCENLIDGYAISINT